MRKKESHLPGVTSNYGLWLLSTIKTSLYTRLHFPLRLGSWVTIISNIDTSHCKCLCSMASLEHFQNSFHYYYNS